MTIDEVVDLLTFARVFDGRVVVGHAEASAWYMALGRIPYAAAEAAVTVHYSAIQNPGAEVPRIMPGHIVAFFRAGHQPNAGHAIPPPSPTPASPEHIAQCKAMVAAAVELAAAKWALEEQQFHDPSEVPRWRPGMDKRKLALAQVEASRRNREHCGL